MESNIPTKEEIIKVLHGCAKVTQEKDGIKIERFFEKEAEAILKLFSEKQSCKSEQNSEIQEGFVGTSLLEYRMSEGTHNKNVNLPY